MKKLLFLIITIQITLFATPFIPINSEETIKGHVDYLEKKYYQLELGKTQTIKVELSDLDADVDLYIAINRKAKIRDNDCYSSEGGTTTEKCGLTSTAPEGKKNSIILLIYGFKASNYQLNIITFEGAESITEISDTPVGGDLKRGESEKYKFLGKKGETYITTLSNLSADADLRVKVGKEANLHTFDCKSTNGGTKTDECSVTLTKDDTVYVHVHGYRTADYKVSVVKEQQNNDILAYAKNVCFNNQNQEENKKVLCPNTNINGTVIYMTEAIIENSSTVGRFYTIQKSNNRWKINKIVNLDDTTNSFYPIEEIKGTSFKLIKRFFPERDSWDIYYDGKLVKSFHSSNGQTKDSIKSIESTDNGRYILVHKERPKYEYPNLNYTEKYDTYIADHWVFVK